MQKKLTTDKSTNLDEFKNNIMPGERRQIPQNTYSMIPFKGNSSTTTATMQCQESESIYRDPAAGSSEERYVLVKMFWIQFQVPVTQMDTVAMH